MAVEEQDTYLSPATVSYILNIASVNIGGCSQYHTQKCPLSFYLIIGSKTVCKRIINNSGKNLTDISLYDEKYGIYVWSKKDYHNNSINIDKDSFINICIYSYISINDLILGYSDNLGQNYKCLLFKDLM